MRHHLSRFEIFGVVAALVVPCLAPMAIAQRKIAEAPVYLTGEPSEEMEFRGKRLSPISASVESVNIGKQTIKVKIGDNLFDAALPVNPDSTWPKIKMETGLTNSDLHVGDSILFPNWPKAEDIKPDASKPQQPTFRTPVFQVSSVNPLWLRMGDSNLGSQVATVPFVPTPNGAAIGVMTVHYSYSFSGISPQPDHFGLSLSITKTVIGFIRSSRVTLEDVKKAIDAGGKTIAELHEDDDGKKWVDRITVYVAKKQAAVTTKQ